MKSFVERIAQTESMDRLLAIINILTEHNIEYYLQHSTFNIMYSQDVHNVIVDINPEMSHLIVLCAHYDTVKNSPGANDNATACALLLNLIINNQITDKHLKFVFTDVGSFYTIGCYEFLASNTEVIDFSICLSRCGIGNNTIYTTYNLAGEELNYIKSILDSNDCIMVDELPKGDAYVFKDETPFPTLYIVNSTDHDVDFYKNFASCGDKDLEKTDLKKTQQKPNDTIDKINFNQVDKIYILLVKVLEAI